MVYISVHSFTNPHTHTHKHTNKHTHTHTHTQTHKQTHTYTHTHTHTHTHKHTHINTCTHTHWQRPQHTDTDHKCRSHGKVGANGSEVKGTDGRPEALQQISQRVTPSASHPTCRHSSHQGTHHHQTNWHSTGLLHCSDGQHSYAAFYTIQYSFIAKCQYNCTRNVLWCQVHLGHIYSNHKTLNYNNSK